MSEVPDIAQNVVAETKESISPPAEIPAVVPSAAVADENLTMDAEDSLPAIPLQESSVPAADNASDMPATFMEETAQEISFAQSGAPFAEQVAAMERKEFEICNREISPSFYSQLITCYLVQQNFQKAKFCRMRAENLANEELKTVIAISKYLENRQTGPALKLIKSANFSDCLRELMCELRIRVSLSTAILIERSYKNIEARRLCEMFDAENSLEEVLNYTGWTLSQDGFVEISLTPQLQALIDERNKSYYGPLSSSKPADSCVIKSSMETLNELARFSSFLEASA